MEMARGYGFDRVMYEVYGLAAVDVPDVCQVHPCSCLFDSDNGRHVMCGWLGLVPHGRSRVFIESSRTFPVPRTTTTSVRFPKSVVEIFVERSSTLDDSINQRKVKLDDSQPIST